VWVEACIEMSRGFFAVFHSFFQMLLAMSEKKLKKVC
jgi:hypothetical protein